MTAQFHSKATAHISERGRKPFKIYLTAREGCFFFRLVKKKAKNNNNNKKTIFLHFFTELKFYYPSYFYRYLRAFTISHRTELPR